MTGEPSKDAGKGGISWPIMAGAGAFLVLCGIFAGMLLQPDRDVSSIPSVLIGREAPTTPLPPVEGLLDADGTPVPGFDPAMLAGRVTLVNVWASWCVPCRDEHPLLVDLARDSRIQIIGINYKDKTEQAVSFISRLGNPFDAVGVDSNGRAAIEWGVYGVPETYLVGPDGRIAYKHVGPLTPQVISDRILPEAARLAGGAG